MWSKVRWCHLIVFCLCFAVAVMCAVCLVVMCNRFQELLPVECKRCCFMWLGFVWMTWSCWCASSGSSCPCVACLLIICVWGMILFWCATDSGSSCLLNVRDLLHIWLDILLYENTLLWLGPIPGVAARWMLEMSPIFMMCSLSGKLLPVEWAHQTWTFSALE